MKKETVRQWEKYGVPDVLSMVKYEELGAYEQAKSG